MKRSGKCTCWVAGALCGIAGSVLANAPTGWFDTVLDYGNDNNSAAWTGPRAWTTVTGSQTDVKIIGTGADLWLTSDSGTFVFKPMVGDCEILATIPALPSDGTLNEWARSGLMMRCGTMRYDADIYFSRRAGTKNEGSRLDANKRLTRFGQTYNWAYRNTDLYGVGTDVRMRLVRQGDAFYGWASTNAPAYDKWDLMASETATAFGEGMSAGFIICRHSVQTGGPTILTNTFNNIIARNLVTATAAEGSASLAWVGDLPLAADYAVSGYSIARQDTADGTFTDLGTTDAATLSYAAALADAAARCRYRVTAILTNALDSTVTSNMLVGTSCWLRNTAVTANPHPVSQKGLYVEYSKNGNYVASRIEPYLYDSWTLTGTSVYPEGASSGLSAYDYFTAVWNGNITVPKTGLYAFSLDADDALNYWIDSQAIGDRDQWEGDRISDSQPVWLEAGRSYSFRVNYTEDSGGEHAKFYYVSDLDAGTRTIVPQAMFEPFPYPWSHADTSAESPVYGTTVYDADAMSFTLYSPGAYGDASKDSAQFVWQDVSLADIDVVATLGALSGDAGSAAGLMARSTLSTDSAIVAVQAVSTGTGYRLDMVTRASAGAAAATTTLAESITLPVQLRLSRRTSEFRLYYNAGAGWVASDAVSSALSGAMMVGMDAVSGTANNSAIALFSGVSCVFTPSMSMTATASGGNANLTMPLNQSCARQSYKSLANSHWYWADSATAPNYVIYRTDNIASNGVAIGTILSPAMTYTDPLNVPANTLVIYRAATVYNFGAMADGNADPNANSILSKACGVSDGTIAGTGTGLFTQCYNGTSGIHATNMPAHVQLRDFGGWDIGDNGDVPFVTAAASDSKVAVGPLNFMVTWAGWIQAPVSGWYQIQCYPLDDTMDLWIGGKQIFKRTGYSNTALTSAAFWLDAGVKQPIYANFSQGGGGGSFHLAWRNGSGNDGETYVAVPASMLYPLAAENAPAFVSPTGANTFGNWANADVNTGRPGHATLAGTPDSFDALLVGGGSDMWDANDGFHFVYQAVSADKDFVLEATMNGFEDGNDWGKVGLMLRSSLDKSARNISILQTCKNGRVMQYRSTDNGATANSGSVNDTFNAGLTAGGTYAPVTFRMERKGGKLSCYINGVSQRWTDNTNLDISGFGDTVYVGLAVTSHSNGLVCHALFNNVTYTETYRPQTLIIIQ